MEDCGETGALGVGAIFGGVNERHECAICDRADRETLPWDYLRLNGIGTHTAALKVT